jgi:hypothetical protein
VDRHSSIGYTRMGNAFIPPALVQADGRFEMLGVILTSIA